MKKKIKKNIFPKSTQMLTIAAMLGDILRLSNPGKWYPPKNRQEMIAEEINMLMYSAKRKNPSFIELYSV